MKAGFPVLCLVAGLVSAAETGGIWEDCPGPRCPSNQPNAADADAQYLPDAPNQLREQLRAIESYKEQLEFKLDRALQKAAKERKEDG